MRILRLLHCGLLSLVTCDFVIYFPENLSSVGQDGSLTLLFLYTPRKDSGRPLAGLTIKIDVMGFADPSGWPYSNLGPLFWDDESDRITDGHIRGSARIWGLSPGALRIRLRLLTSDGTDAIAEDESSFFLDPMSFFGKIMSQQPWVQSVGLQQVETCCGGSVRPQRCFASSHRQQFCNHTGDIFTRSFGSELASGNVGDLQRINLNSTQARTCSTAVVAYIDGYDHERLVPFIESLRASGYDGEVHLIPVSPEVWCDWEGSRWCAHLLSYLNHHRIFLHSFPDTMDYSRQHLRYHDLLLRLQLLGQFCSDAGKHIGAMLVVEASNTIFQSDPWKHPALRLGHGALGLVFFELDDVYVDSSLEVDVNSCWGESGVESGYGMVATHSYAGSREALLFHVAFQLTLAFELIAARGLACTLAALYYPPRYAAFPIRVVAQDTGLFAVLKGAGDLCRAGLREGVGCGRGGASRQECLNLGCCYHPPVRHARHKTLPRCLRPAPRTADGSLVVQDGLVLINMSLASVVIGYDNELALLDQLWARQYAAAVETHFALGKAGVKGGAASVRQVQEQVDDLMGRGRWRGDEWVHASWSPRNASALAACLLHTHLHMFGDSRMRGLSFSLMRHLNHSVDDSDGNLKAAVVPVEAEDLCGGNRRYENHVACGSLLGYALHLRDADTLVAFHELFHYDHAPTLAATISQLVAQARQSVPRRRLVLVMAPGFHMVSSSPLDAGSMMASFLRQVLEELWDLEAGWETAVWMTMEPTAGGAGAWPELDRVNALANRTLRLSKAVVLFDTLPLAAPRPDLLVDGSHYSPTYRRVAAQLLLAPLCGGCGAGGSC